MTPTLLQIDTRTPATGLEMEASFDCKQTSESDLPNLWKRYARAGQGSAAEDTLVQYFLPLVRAVVGRIASTLPPHVSSEDLHSAGLVGLLDAVRRYDSKCGTAFPTYARVRIRGAAFDELRRLDWVPRSVHEKSRKVEKAMRDFEQRNGKAPNEVEMAKALSMKLDDYQDLLEEIKPATFVCLDSLRNAEAEDGSSQYETIADESQADPSEGVMANEMSHMIADRLDQLPEMQRRVLALYYFEDLRLREIAEIFGVTESRICQIHSQAIQNLKSFLRQDDLMAA